MISSAFVVWESPFPPRRGDQYRAAGLISGLAALGPVMLVVLSGDPRDRAAAGGLPPGVVHFPAMISPAERAGGAASGPLVPLGIHLYWSPTAAESLRRRLSRAHFDLAVCYQLRAAYYHRCVRATTRALELTDSFALYQRNVARATSTRGRLAGAYADAIRRGILWTGVDALEKRLPEEFDITWLSAGEDLHHIKDVLGTRGSLALVPPGCFPPIWQDADDLITRRRGRPRRLLFLGNLAYLPNRDAVALLAREIQPALERLWGEDRPEIWIAGGGWPQARRYFPGVRFLGYVEDIASLSVEVDLALNPVRLGSGASSKVTEGWRMGLPVISSHFGARGFTPGPALQIADAPEHLVEVVRQVLTDPAAYRKGLNDALTRCRENTWEKIVRRAVERLNGRARRLPA